MATLNIVPKVMLLMALFSPGAPLSKGFASGQTAEKRPVVALQLQGQPRWSLGTSLERAPISERFKTRIVEDLLGEGMPPETIADVKQYTMVYAYSIPSVSGVGGRRVLRVWGGGESCGGTGNCQVLIYDAKTGQTLLSETGWDF